MALKHCRKCNASIKADLDICPHCGAGEPPLSILAPITNNPIKVGIVAILVAWMIYVVVGDTSPFSHIPPADTGVKDETPPHPPTSVDSGEAQVLQKAQWVVQTLRSSKRAQMCGLRGQMWATRMEDLVFADETKAKAKSRTETADLSEFDRYASTLRAWEMQHLQPPHPSEYECAEMARSPEIDLLFRVESDLKESQQ